MARPNLRVIHSHGSTEDLLFRANEHLALGEASEALPLYTLVLYDTCPGHIFALLNRAIAYKALGYPELAVTDAYRAAIASHEMRDMKSHYASARFNYCKRYLRAESLHVEANEQWTSSAVPGERDHSMALLTFNFEIPAAGVIGEGKKRAELCNRIEHRAIYRMCDALQHCGGGALSDGIGIISDSCGIAVGFWEKKHVWELGEEMMRDIERAFRDDETRPPDATTQQQHVSMKEMMQTKTTMVNREIYPWNDKEPDPHSLLSIPLDEHTTNCTLGLHHPEPGLAPTLSLRAAHDIYPSTDVLHAKWSYMVASNEPFSLNPNIQSAPPPLENAHPCSARSMYNHPKAQSLYDRILFLVLARAIDKDTHPLDNDDIASLAGAFHLPRASTSSITTTTTTEGNAAPERRKTLPWSFANNVVRPIHYIQTYTQEQVSNRGGRSHFFRLAHFDGWVINTLLAKITHSIRIQAGYKAAPLVSERSPVRRPAGASLSPASNPRPALNPPRRRRRRLRNRGSWVGTISPLFGTIRVADATKGERANVVLDDYDGARLCTAEGEDMLRPCVGRGELILRDGDGIPGLEEEGDEEEEEKEEESVGGSEDEGGGEGGRGENEAVGEMSADEADFDSDQAVFDSDEVGSDTDGDGGGDGNGNGDTPMADAGGN